MDEPLTIGALAARTGLPTSTLRYYDRIGLIPATGRSAGQRRYDPKVIGRVRAARCASDRASPWRRSDDSSWRCSTGHLT
jgi:DNA-binding transcriptional MerR regulator